jgi:hypothetical protein
MYLFPWKKISAAVRGCTESRSGSKCEMHENIFCRATSLSLSSSSTSWLQHNYSFFLLLFIYTPFCAVLPFFILQPKKVLLADAELE